MLCDAGTIKLFDQLYALDSGRNRINTIELKFCAIGDDGLLAISRFLENNTILKSLCLQGVSILHVIPMSKMVSPRSRIGLGIVPQ